MKALKLKKYIKETEKTMQNQCAICNYIAEKPYSCNGRCGQTFCFQCMNCIKRNSNECPFRCSSPFELTERKEVELEFKCPFNPEECRETIPSLSGFYAHNDCCKFVPGNWKEREENFKNYKCDKGHDLFYMDAEDLIKLYGYSYYDVMMQKICSSCSDQTLCRTICPTCSLEDQHLLFCPNCRKAPCTKDTCLYSHKLQKLEIGYRKGLICDFCGTAAYLLGPFAFRDTQCNFDICEVCYVNLPETHELVPFKMSKTVIDHLAPKKKIRNYFYQDSDSSEQEEIAFRINNEIRSRIQQEVEHEIESHSNGSQVEEEEEEEVHANQLPVQLIQQINAINVDVQDQGSQLEEEEEEEEEEDGNEQPAQLQQQINAINVNVECDQGNSDEEDLWVSDSDRDEQPC